MTSEIVKKLIFTKCGAMAKINKINLVILGAGYIWKNTLRLLIRKKT